MAHKNRFSPELYKYPVVLLLRVFRHFLQIIILRVLGPHAVEELDHDPRLCVRGLHCRFLQHSVNPAGEPGKPATRTTSITKKINLLK